MAQQLCGGRLLVRVIARVFAHLPEGDGVALTVARLSSPSPARLVEDRADLCRDDERRPKKAWKVAKK